MSQSLDPVESFTKASLTQMLICQSPTKSLKFQFGSEIKLQLLVLELSAPILKTWSLVSQRYYFYFYFYFVYFMLSLKMRRSTKIFWQKNETLLKSNSNFKFQISNSNSIQIRFKLWICLINQQLIYLSKKYKINKQY